MIEQKGNQDNEEIFFNTKLNNYGSISLITRGLRQLRHPFFEEKNVFLSTWKEHYRNYTEFSFCFKCISNDAL